MAEVTEEQRQRLFLLVAGKEYHQAITLLREQPDLARMEAGRTYTVMRVNAAEDNRPFEYGWQLGGEELGVIAELRRAGASCSDLSLPKAYLQFSYVARLETSKPKGYIVDFPDLPGCATEGETIKEAVSQARDSLTSYLLSKMNHGEQLPQPKYKTGKDSKRIKRRKITLTLDEMVVSAGNE